TPAVGTFSAGIPMCQTQASPPSGSGPQSPPGWLEPGSRLTAGQSVTSTNGGFQLLMQGDGNLVSYLDPAVYGHAVPIWNSGTYGHSGAYSVMQSDGNLVVYAPGGQALWWSGTNGHPGALAVMQSDGNLVVYSAYSGGSALWNSHTYGRTVTTPSTYCTANQNVFGNDTWKVCEYTTVWFNGAHSGVLSPTAVHEGCAAIGPLPLGESINCGPETQGSYIRSGNVNEDWVNQMIVDANSQSYNTYYCVYLRVDTPPGGNAWAQQPQLVSKGVIKPTC
ncbi:MAG TPA: hypothetical protein VFH70_12655, partial [Acidimicrobiales bacterium]|nr:hypothetical protein [Acidimicrobiales bacterium]